ncbi:CaiB/BaiF CoA transferase family protein [Falsiroseomonas sp. HW251]|uniref:CaiB/BaiF CoA transferase family protein n=1 Tax=Falsiroseomonas sp. HW251 TaxID=3390998 RepID=UPI003D310340
MSDLSGVLVVAVEQAVAAPYCSCRLADAGARVIKVERREGDFARGYDRHVKGLSTYFVWLNRGKESIALDLKNPDDLEVLQRIAARADVFIQNLAPGALCRLGLDSATLRARHPRLITCDISGYGESGPLADLKAYDLLVQAESGLCSVTGDATGPARVGVSVCDIAAGMNAHAAILQALYARTRTGQGRAIKVSLFSGMADWMNVPFLQRRYGGEIAPRPGLAHPSIAPYGVFRVRDGLVLISIQNEREWARFCAEVLGDAALATDPLFEDGPARVRNRADLDGRIAACFAQLTLAEAAERLKGAEVAFGRLNDIDGLIAHPQLRKVSYDTPQGVVEVIAPAAEIVGEEPAFGRVPAVDAHGAAIRREFDARGAAA